MTPVFVVSRRAAMISFVLLYFDAVHASRVLPDPGFAFNSLSKLKSTKNQPLRPHRCRQSHQITSARCIFDGDPMQPVRVPSSLATPAVDQNPTTTTVDADNNHDYTTVVILVPQSIILGAQRRPTSSSSPTASRWSPLFRQPVYALFLRCSLSSRSFVQ